MDECKKTKKITHHLCKAGLLDIAIPLLHQGELVGYLMIGQIKKDTNKFPSFHFDGDSSVIEGIYNNLPVYDDEKINSIINIATMLTRYIVFDNMVKPSQTKSASLITGYIDSHLNDPINANELAREIHMSKSGIYKCMQKNYGLTPGEFICARRIEKAQELLEESELSISQIADRVGFSDAAYFSRCFKKLKGVSPIKYRSEIKLKNKICDRLSDSHK